MYGPDAYAVRNVGGRIRRKKTIKNTTLQKESSFRPVVVRKPVRAPESAGSFIADRCHCACTGALVRRLPGFLVTPSPTHRPKGTMMLESKDDGTKKERLILLRRPL